MSVSVCMCLCVYAPARVLTDKSGRCFYLFFYLIESCFAQHLQSEAVTQSLRGRVQVGMAKCDLSSLVNCARADVCGFRTSSWVTPLALLSAARFQAIDIATFARSVCVTKHWMAVFGVTADTVMWIRLTRYRADIRDDPRMGGCP